jgi:hypothetical protein
VSFTNLLSQRNHRTRMSYVSAWNKVSLYNALVDLATRSDELFTQPHRRHQLPPKHAEPCGRGLGAETVLTSPTSTYRAPDNNDRQPARLLGNGFEQSNRQVSPNSSGRATVPKYRTPLLPEERALLTAAQDTPVPFPDRRA